MRYFKAIAKMGHYGCGKWRDVPIYVYANNLIDAMIFVKALPAIKLGKIPDLKEITEEEFIIGRAQDEYKRAILESKGIEYETCNNLH